jgi:hypothetical protein
MENYQLFAGDMVSSRISSTLWGNRNFKEECVKKLKFKSLANNIVNEDSNSVQTFYSIASNYEKTRTTWSKTIYNIWLYLQQNIHFVWMRTFVWRCVRIKMYTVLSDYNNNTLCSVKLVCKEKKPSEVFKAGLGRKGPSKNRDSKIETEL